MPRLRYLVGTFFIVCAALSSGYAQQAQKPETKSDIPARYAATAFGQHGSTYGKSFGLTIYVQGLTSDGDIQELVGILKETGQEGVARAMGKMKDKGQVSPAASVGTGVRVVRIRPSRNGGQHIVLATDRPISFGEAYNSTRSRDYPIGIVVLDVDKDGKGTGTFAVACKIKFNKNDELQIEHYGQKPLRLANVYRQN
jgi:hypothetical protein